MNDKNYPWNYQLSAYVLHVRLYFGCDLDLVTVESDTLQVGQQIFLGAALGTLVRYLAS